MDANGDGKIDRGELESWEREEREREKRERDERLQQLEMEEADLRDAAFARASMNEMNGNGRTSRSEEPSSPLWEGDGGANVARAPASGDDT